MSSSATIVLVTGANRGIGFAIVQALAAHRSNHFTFLIGGRDDNKASTAIIELQALGLQAEFQALRLDVTDDQSIQAAVEQIKLHHGRLDVLVNNAGYATPISADNTNYRAVWMRTLNTNVISVGLITTFFLPLLHLSADPRVINISSARGSFALVTSGSNPPTMNQAYSVSKTALNMLHVAMSKSYPSVLFQLVSPGFTKTAFNRFTGTKDPLDSARSVVELVCAAKEKYCAGFWQWEGKGMEEVDW